MRVVVALVALVVASVTQGTAQAEDWVEYRPDGIGFRIEMPDEPKLETKKAKSGTSYQAVVGLKDSAFLVIYGDKDSKKSDSELLLDAAVQGQTDGKKVLDIKKEKLGGLPARRVKLRDSDNDEFEIRTVIVDGRLLQVLFVGPLGDRLGRRFLDSLVLLNQ